MLVVAAMYTGDALQALATLTAEYRMPPATVLSTHLRASYPCPTSEIASASMTCGSAVFMSCFLTGESVQAARDVRDVILRAAARLNVPIRWLPDRIAEQNFNLEEPPSQASPWVPVLLGHLQTFVERLVDMSALSPPDVHQASPYCSAVF